jgi:SAM-dependent methyltransferase
MKRCLECHAAFGGARWDCPSCGHRPEQQNGILLLAPELADQAIGMDIEAFALLSEYEAESFWFRARNRLVGELLGRHFPHAASFLEVGCGNGFVLSGLPCNGLTRIAGSDLHPAGLLRARERVPYAELVQMDARHVPYENEWDVIGAFDVLEHIEEDRDVLVELRRALRPGGGLIVSVPQHPWLWGPFDEYAHHVRRYTRRDLVEKVHAAGFTVQRTTSFVFTLLPAMVVSRLLQRLRGAQAYDPASEYRLPRALDAAFGRALDVEFGLIRRDVSLPAGGSLFVVATA